MGTLNITKDKQTQKQLDLLDEKMDKLLDEKINLDNRIKELVEERKSVLRQFYRNCEDSQKDGGKS